MSVLKVGEAIPSRIAGVFRYLLTCDHRQEKRERLEKMLSPEKLRPPDSVMIRRVINEIDHRERR